MKVSRRRILAAIGAVGALVAAALLMIPALPLLRRTNSGKEDSCPPSHLLHAAGRLLAGRVMDRTEPGAIEGGRPAHERF